MLYIGVDLGTSAMKLLLLNAEGNILNTVSKPYCVFYPQELWSEQRPEDWRKALFEGIPRLLSGFDPKKVRAIGAAGQMHGLVILDKDDNVIRPAILWNDGRSKKETEYLNSVIGKERLLELTANIAYPGFTAPKLLWLRKNEPDSFAETDKIMLPKDYINYILSGVHCTDYSDASGTLLLDVKNKKWSDEMLDICSINKKQMPKLFESYESVGRIRPEVSRLLGLSEDVLIAVGAGDNAAAALAAGATGEGRCNISLGTSGTVFMSSESFRPGGNEAIHSFAHADGKYHLMACILSAASCNSWFAGDILGSRDFEAEQKNIDPKLLGENAVYFLPYLMGERSPINDTDARAMFIGMSMNTKRCDMLQAVFEGVAFAIRDCVEIARNNGMEIKSSCICGGGAKSKLWKKIMANVLHMRLESMETEQGPGMGAALLAMVADGHFADVRTACDNIVRISGYTEPDAELERKYDICYSRFKKIYPCCKELFKELRPQKTGGI